MPGLGIDDGQYTPIRYYDIERRGGACRRVYGIQPAMMSRPRGTRPRTSWGLPALKRLMKRSSEGKDGKIIYIEDKWGKNIRTLYEVPDAGRPGPVADDQAGIAAKGV